MDRRQEASQIRTEAQARIDEIRKNGDLTAEAKARSIAGARQSANNKLRELKSSELAEHSKQRDAALAKAFGVSFGSSATSSDKVLARMSLRDAVFRASSLKTAAEAESMFDIARTIGDRDLQKAVGFAAFRLGWSGILDRFAETSQDIADALTELSQSGAATGTRGRMADSMHFSQISETPEERSTQTFRNAA
jgi:hypothetical protein